MKMLFTEDVWSDNGCHTSIMEGFKKSGPRRTETIILDYIRPVEFNGDTFEILGWGCTILILASFEGV